MESAIAHLGALIERFLQANSPAPTPSLRDASQVLGLVLIAALVLVGNHYLLSPLSISLTGLSGSALADPQRILWALLLAVGYALPPLLYCRLTLPDAWAALGLTRTRLRTAAAIWLGFAVLTVPLLVLLSMLPSFQAIYPMARGNSGDPLSMALWLVAYGLQFVGLEVFFRGFLVLAPRRILGVWGLGLMLLPYTMLHFQKPLLESLGSIGFGLLLGVLALRTRSIVEGIGVHLIVAYTLEVLGAVRSLS